MRLAVCLLLAASGSGCAQRRATIPPFAPAFAPADWTVLGETNHEECGLYVLAIDWGHLFVDQAARVTGVLAVPIVGPRLLPEEARALYHALDKMPEATHLMAHRSRVETQGIALLGRPVFGERCVAVEARGVRIGDRPAPPR